MLKKSILLWIALALLIATGSILLTRNTNLAGQIYYYFGGSSRSANMIFLGAPTSTSSRSSSSSSSATSLGASQQSSVLEGCWRNVVGLGTICVDEPRLLCDLFKGEYFASYSACLQVHPKKPSSSSVRSSSMSLMPVATTVGETPQVHCCLCHYQDVPECYFRKDEAACNVNDCTDGKDNDGDAKIDALDPGCQSAHDTREADGLQNNDCIWNEDKCIGRFQYGCRQWMQEIRKSRRCDAEMIEKENGDVMPRDFLSKCTTVRYHRDGHGQGCESFVTEIMGCLKCAEHCSRFFATDVGCSTFSNIDEANKWIKRIQEKAGPDQRISVNAEQTLSSDACKNTLKYYITSDLIIQESSKCHSSGAMCYATSNPIICTGEDGKQTTEICCKTGGDGATATYGWKRGSKC